MVSISTSKTSISISKQSNITIIGAVTFLHISKLSDSKTSDFFNIFSEYHKFADVFSKTKAEILTSYCPYDLQINLEEGTQSLIGPIYSLLASKQKALKEFIEENLNMGFI